VKPSWGRTGAAGDCAGASFTMEGSRLDGGAGASTSGSGAAEARACGASEGGGGALATAASGLIASATTRATLERPVIGLG
jgi:hypothetical protein